MSLSFEEVEHIANLARLTLSDEEKKKYQQQLSSILDYITMLQELDTSSIPPTSSVLPTQCPLREDQPGKSMTIPYRCMLPQNKEGLIVAGRCVSYEAPVANCIRCMPQCMVMGEAAGTAAAIAAKQGVTPRNVDISLLQATLRRQNAIL